MKAFSKVMVLMMITLMSGASFAAESKVGVSNSPDCVTNTDNRGAKAQATKSVASDEVKGKDTKAEKAD